jgi:hypothetical protein
VNAESTILAESRPRWRRRVAVVLRRSRLMPLAEIATVLALIVSIVVTYFVTTRGGARTRRSHPRPSPSCWSRFSSLPWR